MDKTENNRMQQNKENKFKKDMPELHAEKAADYVPSMNEIPKQNNPV